MIEQYTATWIFQNMSEKMKEVELVLKDFKTL